MADREISAANGYYHIATNPKIYNPVRSNNFELHVMGLENLVRAGMDSADDNAIITNAAEVIRFSVVSCDIPTFTQNPIEISYGNNKLKYAGKPDFKQGALVIYDYMGADGKSVLMAWQNQSFNIKTWSVGKAEDYKKEAYLLEYSPDWELIRSWKLFGVWVHGIENGQYNNDSDEAKQVTANLSYDYAQMEVN